MFTLAKTTPGYSDANFCEKHGEILASNEFTFYHSNVDIRKARCVSCHSLILFIEGTSTKSSPEQNLTPRVLFVTTRHLKNVLLYIEDLKLLHIIFWFFCP